MLYHQIFGYQGTAMNFQGKLFWCSIKILIEYLHLTQMISTYVGHILFLIFIGEELVISILKVLIPMFIWQQEEVEVQLVLLGWGQYVLQILDSGQMWTHTFTELTSKMDM